MNIRSLAKGLQYCGVAAGKRQTYYVFESGRGYVVMSASRTKRASGYFNLVSRDAVNRIRKSYAGKQDVTSDHGLLGNTGPAPQPQPSGELTLVHLCTVGQPRLLRVLGDDSVEGLDVFQRPAHEQRIGHAPTVVGKYPHPGR